MRCDAWQWKMGKRVPEWQKPEFEAAARQQSRMPTLHLESLKLHHVKQVHYINTQIHTVSSHTSHICEISQHEIVTWRSCCWVSYPQGCSCTGQRSNPGVCLDLKMLAIQQGVIVPLLIVCYCRSLLIHLTIFWPATWTILCILRMKNTKHKNGTTIRKKNRLSRCSTSVCISI